MMAEMADKDGAKERGWASRSDIFVRDEISAASLFPTRSENRVHGTVRPFSWFP